LLLFMAVILESKQSVVWSKVCGLSRPIIMAAAESKESHRAVGELLLPSLSPFVAPYSGLLFLLTSWWVSMGQQFSLSNFMGLVTCGVGVTHHCQVTPWIVGVLGSSKCREEHHHFPSSILLLLSHLVLS
jgi:hypothetical protein